MNRTRRFHGPDRSSISLPWIHILLTLADGERHGYAIMREVEERTEGEVTLWPATLYGAIKRMTTAGLVEAAPGDVAGSAVSAADTGSRRRRSYRITDLGRRVLGEETARLSQIVDLAREKKVFPSSGGA